MKRGWFLLLALSLGLNAGLIYTTLVKETGEPQVPPPPAEPGVPAPDDPAHAPDAPVPPTVGSLIQARHERMSRFLDLTPEQRRRGLEILQSRLPRLLALRGQVAEARNQIHAAYRQPEIDQQRIRRLVEKLTSAQAQVDSLAAEMMLQEVALLTLEQRQAYWRAMPFGLHHQPGGRRLHGMRHHRP